MLVFHGIDFSRIKSIVENKKRQTKNSHTILFIIVEAFELVGLRTSKPLE